MMFWFIRMHHYKHGDIEQQYETDEGLARAITESCRNGWVVTYIKLCNGNQEVHDGRKTQKAM